MATILTVGRLAVVALARLDGRTDVAYPMVGERVDPEEYMRVVDALNLLAREPAMSDEEWRAHLWARAEAAAFVEAGLRFASDPLGVANES